MVASVAAPTPQHVPSPVPFAFAPTGSRTRTEGKAEMLTSNKVLITGGVGAGSTGGTTGCPYRPEPVSQGLLAIPPAVRANLAG